jgi:hypothetical protein
MVWSQYIEDGNYDLDVELNEHGEVIEDDEDHMTIHDWESKYSDELWELWDLMNTLIHDAWLERTIFNNGNFNDFVEFCYKEHHESPMYLYCPVIPNISYIWRKIQECMDDMNVKHIFMVGATLDHFLDFIGTHTSQNNIRIY